MLSDKKEILDNTAFIRKKREDKAVEAIKADKRRYFILSIFLSVAIISLCYFLSSSANISRIDVTGSIYLKDGDIAEFSGLNLKKKYLLTSDKNVEKKLAEHPLIEECKVRHLDKNVIEIDVREKKLVGYSYEQLDNVLILSDDSRIELDKNNMYLIEKIPLILGFDKEELIVLEKNLSKLDYRLIDEISEIHYYPDLKYQYVEIIMRDGNYIFTSPYGLDILNRYYDIKSSYGSSANSCFYFEDISGNAYVSNCPWQNPPEPIEEEE